MQPRPLELLAPARNLDIGIAAIDCGADAVYIAGPAFGARQAAGNSVEDIAALCSYAHRFGVRIFVTVNTILYEDELEQARLLVRSLKEAGVDALIVQDLALTQLCRGMGLPLHASTQCAIRTPERAAFLNGLGFSRLVPERQLSLDEIRAISAAVPGCEIECFVHGALCVCYSGQCYLSEFIDGRSANRGACIQACRSRYDLVDGHGKVLVRDKALLSLKDFNLLSRLGDLAGAGACSFKIEGRLKSISYVRNVVRAYSQALDELVRTHPDLYRRASLGKVIDSFEPDLQKTFQRGYTSFYLDGKRSRGWSSADAPKSIGEEVGTVLDVRPSGQEGVRIDLRLAPGVVLQNGDGFAFLGERNALVGFRGDVCEGHTVRCNRPVIGLRPGVILHRNISAAFEKEMERRPGRRMIAVTLSLSIASDRLFVSARREDGLTASESFSLEGAAPARDCERMRSIFSGQLEKSSGPYLFTLESLPEGPLPLLKTAFLNEIRRRMAEALDLASQRVDTKNASQHHPDVNAQPFWAKNAEGGEAGFYRCYKENVANSLSRKVLSDCGAEDIAPAYELSYEKGAELMRSRYCIRYETGLCPRFQGAKDPGPLFLLNNGRRLSLGFDCARCEMTVREG